MTIPQWAVLGFGVWTLVVLFVTVGFYRWSRILSGRVRISEWQADVSQGSEWYRRAMRAHLNCVENLPVFGATVYCATVAGAEGTLFNILAIAVLGARLGQTLVHLSVTQTDAVVATRFGFFLIQAMGMLGIAAIAVLSALSF